MASEYQKWPIWRVFEAGQTVLPDRSILIGHKLVKMLKLDNSNETFLVVFKHRATFRKSLMVARNSFF